MLRLKYKNKYIWSIFFITCISLVLSNFILNDNSKKILQGSSSRIIVESPKSKENLTKEGTRVIMPSTNEKFVSPVQPLPVPKSNATIIVNPL